MNNPENPTGSNGNKELNVKIVDDEKFEVVFNSINCALFSTKGKFVLIKEGEAKIKKYIASEIEDGKKGSAYNISKEEIRAALNKYKNEKNNEEKDI